MIQRGDSAGFPLEALAKLLGADLDGYRAVEPNVPRLVDLAMPPAPIVTKIS